MSDLNKLTIADARDGLRKGDFTSLDLTEACLGAIEGAGVLNAYSHKTPDAARAMAAAADQRIKAGDAPAMCGIPLGIKDLFCTRGVPSQAASRILDGFLPQYESTVTQNLWDAGAVMLGKLGMDEFAMGSTNRSLSCYGPVVNPWKVDDRQLTPGGSSGGSAAAVAADLCLAAAGTDTGGSIRQPAAFTGIVGLKPTYGRVSRWGVIAFASSLDQAGPMTKTVRDAAIMLGAMASVDPKDSTSAEREVPDYEAALTGDIRGKKIGIPREYRMEGMSDEIDALWRQSAEMLRDAGAEIVDISLPHTKYALPAYYVIAPAEASSNLARYDGVRYGRRAKLGAGDGVVEMYEKTRAQGFGPEVQRRIMIGTYVLSAGFYDAYYNRARRVRALIKRDFDQAYASGVDAILTPATPSAAFGLGEMSGKDPVEMYLIDVFTVTLNLAGLPGISVPVGLDKQGLPLGMQLIGRPWDEAGLLNLAQTLEFCGRLRGETLALVVTGQKREKRMRNLLILSVLALAACGENSGWNPNYSGMNNGSGYAKYMHEREAALHGRGAVPSVIPVQLPAKAPTAADLSGTAQTKTTTTVTAANAAKAPANLPVTTTGPYPGSTPVLVRYAHQERQDPGAKVYKRTGGSVLDAGRSCSGYASAEIAQRAFIAAGGPILDPRGMDPDGDGFVCGWDPRPLRNSSGL